MGPIYQYCCKVLNQPCDEAKLSAMMITSNQTLESLEEKIKDAETNQGEQEIRDALLAKAEFIASIGDREAATTAFAASEAKTTGSGLKMDLVFSQLRLLMFYEDWPGVKKLISKAKQLSDAGGDWERRNKLKVTHDTAKQVSPSGTSPWDSLGHTFIRLCLCLPSWSPSICL